MESNSLDKIINRKKEKLNLLKNKFKIEDLKYKINKFDKFLDFKEKIYSNFSKGKFSLIAEIKKASPSAGIIIEDYDPVKIANIYNINKDTFSNKRVFFSHRRESQKFRDTGRMLNIIAFDD